MHYLNHLILGTWINIPFLQAQSLLQGTTYCIAVGGYMHPTDSVGAGVSGTGTASSDRLFDKDDHYQNGAASWYTIGDIPMLRMNFDSSTLNNIEDETLERINIFPNPSSGIITVNADVFESITINIKNMLGQDVYNDKLTSLSNKVDLSSYDKGVYTIELKANGKAYSEKVLIE